jgi:hypothetical protein
MVTIMNPQTTMNLHYLAIQTTDWFLLAVIDIATRIVLYGTAISVLMILFGVIMYFTGLSRDLGKKTIKSALGIVFFCALIFLGLMGFDAWPDLSQVFYIPS